MVDKDKATAGCEGGNGNRRSPSLRRRFYGEALAEWPIIGVGVAAMFVTTAANQALPWVIGRMIDTMQKRDAIVSSSSSSSINNRSLSLSHTLLAVVAAGGLASCVRTIALQTASARIAARLRLSAVSYLLIHQPLQWFHNTAPTSTNTTTSSTPSDITRSEASSAETEPVDTIDASKDKPDTDTSAADVTVQGMSPAAIQSIMTDDVTKMADSLTTGTANLLRSSSAVIWSTHHMIAVNPTLLGVAIGVVPIVGAVAMVLHKSVQRVSKLQRSSAEAAASFLYERLSHIAMVRLANRSHDEVDTFETLQCDSMHKAQTKAVYSGIFMGFLFSATASALSLVVYQGSQSVRRGVMTGGQLTSFSTYCFLLGLGTSGVVKALAETASALVAAERYYSLVNDTSTAAGSTSSPMGQGESSVANVAVDTNSNSVVSTSTDSLDMNRVEALHVQNVSFAYGPNQPRVLDAVSFQIPRGKVVALVGRNGEGKSTLVSLLAGLYEPECGSIQVVSDNDKTVDYATLSKACKKSLVQVIPQNTALFNMSILENVRYGNPNATIEQVQAALTEADCDDFVARLTDGMYASIGLDGCRLSGGERQKLALARAILSNPIVLVMDEGTSSMDEQGLLAVSKAVVQSTRHHRRGLLLVTHQPKTLELTDTILVLQQGQIVEQGEYAVLRSDENSQLCQLLPDVYRKTVE